MDAELNATGWTRLDDPPAGAARFGGSANRTYYRHADGRLCYRARGQGSGIPCTASGFTEFRPQVPAEEFGDS